MAFWVGRQSVMEASFWYEIGRNGINQLMGVVRKIRMHAWTFGGALGKIGIDLQVMLNAW